MAITLDSSAPLVVVVGSTGSQGGSVIKALAESNIAYRIRGLTRDPSKPAAQALAKRGVEVVTFDPNPVPENKAKIFKAFEGATYAFTMTIASATATEAAEGKNLVDAAKAANVRLLVWSGLESLAEVSGGKYTNVVAFENKAEVTRYAQASGTPVVYVPAAGYMQNYTTNHSIPKKQPDGSFAMFNVMSPDSKVFLIDTDEDYGLFVRKAIESDGGETELLTHGDILTPVEIARTISEGTGKTVNYVQVSPEAYKKSLTSNGLPEFVATMLAEMWLTIDEFGYYGKKDAGPSLQGLARKPRTFAEFVKATDWSSILV